MLLDFLRRDLVQGIAIKVNKVEGLFHARQICDLRRAVAALDVTTKLQGMGLQIATGTPEAFGNFLKAEVEMWTRVAKQANIQED